MINTPFHLKAAFALAAAVTGTPCSAQSDYHSGALRHRQAYKEAFITDTHSPLTAADTGYLRFYPINPALVCTARIALTPDARPFPMSTHAGTKKEYVTYGTATLDLPADKAGNGRKKQQVTVHIYRSAVPSKDTAYADHLFLPFYDLTNGSETYGGGRYLDLAIRNIKDGKVVIDFNQAYNMYCVYADGYACPIPPDENRLPVHITAGEKLFARPIEED